MYATAGDVPSGVITVTFTEPADAAGSDATIVVADSTVNAIADGTPNFTSVAPRNPVPVMTTWSSSPAPDGLIDEITGDGVSSHPVNGFAIGVSGAPARVLRSHRH